MTMLSGSALSRKLYKNVAVWLAAIVLAIAVAAAFAAESESAARAREDAIVQLTSLARQVALRLDRGMFERYREFELISSRPTLGDPAVPLAEKQRLLDEYNGQIARKDIDGAIGTVRKLDFYLTSDEGQGMAESVRNLFKEKLNQLKDRFTAAVHRGQWAEAHRVGESIVNDFPNTQMAKEVRDKLESLKQRALEPQGPIATATA